ncbi:electron transfer flavoprotein alpha-subunit FixB [Kocuria dechangensis]|uniref:Electron transfer flavoprotein alpha-subunit FixB n=1 Tax=Kocuria dechangensis TaxID=1176249 RepID=A0A917LXS8_9MICC|nr:electron transfer flavoprotein subunit alpha/FixB family protein [Kocuria dechangensis]GGG65979.1 electron transfer flavoprotein alpha-subunit FixB [Kocuria dechangensis]
MKNVLVYLGSWTGTLDTNARGLLEAATRLGAPVAVLSSAGQERDEIAEDLGALGVEQAYVEHRPEDDLLVVREVALLQAALRAVPDAAAVVLPSTTTGREVGGRLAVLLDGAYLNDVVEADTEDGHLTTVQEVWGGSYTVRAAVPTDGAVSVLCLRERAGTDDNARATTCTAEPLSVDLAPNRAAKVTTRRSPGGPTPTTGRPALKNAKIVVSGGRGVGSAEKFALVENLADVLGAAVGASRAAVEADYCGRELQVGQTGVVVSPQVYIALGISGALQHRMGMQTADTIIAVNKDPDAPIFELADLGVIGDISTVVPQLVDLLKHSS